MSKNTICLWYDKDAEAAARFYAATFPDSAVDAVRHAPSDYPGGKEGDVLTVEFTVLFNIVSASTAVPSGSRYQAFSFRVRPKIRKRRTATGTQSSVMAGRRASAGGAKTSGEFPWQITLGVLTDALAAGGDEAKRAFRCDDGNEENRHRRDREAARLKGSELVPAST